MKPCKWNQTMLCPGRTITYQACLAYSACRATRGPTPKLHRTPKGQAQP